MPRTMARLDKELDNGVSFMKRLNRLEGMAKGLRKFIKSASRRGRSRSRSRDDDDFAADAKRRCRPEQGRKTQGLLLLVGDHGRSKME
jgi:hypothetical protein